MAIFMFIQSLRGGGGELPNYNLYEYNNNQLLQEEEKTLMCCG